MTVWTRTVRLRGVTARVEGAAPTRSRYRPSPRPSPRPPRSACPVSPGPPRRPSRMLSAASP